MSQPAERIETPRTTRNVIKILNQAVMCAPAKAIRTSRNSCTRTPAVIL